MPSMEDYHRQKQEEFKRNVKLAVKIGGGAFAAIFALSIFFGGFYTVDAGQKAVHTRFGSIVNVTDPGLHFKVPIIDDVTKISARTKTLDWHAPNADDKNERRMEAYSHDQQPAMMSVKLAFHIRGDEKSIRQLYTQFRNDEGLQNAVLVPRAAQAIKTTFGQFTAVSVVQNRAEFNARAAKAVQELIDQGVDGQPVPVIIDGVQVYDIKFSQAYEHAVEERMKAEVEVAKVSQNLERERKTAEITVVQAKAEAESNLAKAKAAAEAVRIRGEAEAAAIRARAAALQSNPFLVQLTVAEKWDGKLPSTMVPNGTLPFLDLHK